MYPVSKVEFRRTAHRNPYFRGRWPYIEVARDYAMKCLPHSALELGSNGFPIFRGNGVHTMDFAGEVTFRHDATKFPWPPLNDSYDVFVALQVFEHLSPHQPEAFREVMRVAKHAVISVPLGWDKPDDKTHHAITRDRVRDWCCGVEPAEERVVFTIPNRDRLVMRFDFTCT